MKDNKVKILKNFQDIDFSSLKLRRDFEINSLNYLIDSGYVNIDTPVIESADLFLENLWGALQGIPIHLLIFKISKLA